MKRKRYMVWFVHLPGHVYAYNAWLSEPGTAKDARAWMRNWLGVKRLPNGTTAWPKDNCFMSVFLQLGRRITDMKLKKAVREYARAVDELAQASVQYMLTMPEDSDFEYFRDRLLDASREKRRTVRQMSAVAHALQYRGANKIAYEQPVLLATKRDQLYVYIARLAWETSEIRDKMLSPCSASIKDEVEKGARSGTLFERTLGWRSDADFYANRVLAGAVRDRYPLDDYAELGVYMFKQEWKDKHFVSIVASGTIEECISIDEHANCSE